MNILVLILCCNMMGFSQTIDNTKNTDIFVGMQSFSLPKFDNDFLQQSRYSTSNYAFAHPYKVNINPQSHGTWAYEGTQAIWRLRIHSETAYSLNFGFTEYDMPGDGQLNIYTESDNQRLGPFTSNDNESHGQLWTPIIDGSSAIIELRISKKYIPRLKLKLGSINHGFNSFLTKSGDLDCYIDVVCGIDDGWAQVEMYRDQIRSVGVITDGTGSGCTGFLINNTEEDQKPYLLTAEHCFALAETVAASLVIYWGFENSYCREQFSDENGQPGDGELIESTVNSGAYFRAKNKDSDFVLFELDDPINPAANAFFAGWDRRDIEPKTNVCIHHPDGKEKRISFDNDPSLISPFGGDPQEGETHLRIENWDFGSTESGSSGGPIFNESGRVVGQLEGGLAACGNQDADWFGRFYTSWEGGGTPESQLKYWLDPQNKNVETLNGIEADLAQPMVVEVFIEAQLACADDENASILIEVNGGTPPYLYKLQQGGGEQESGLFSNLAAGVYQFTITDSGGQSVETEAIEILNPPLLIIESLIQNGSDIVINAMGGTGDLMYSVNGGPFQPSKFVPVMEQGTYHITVMDDNDCTAEDQILVTWESLQVNQTVDLGSCDQSGEGGSVMFEVSGGIPPYYLSFNNMDIIVLENGMVIDGLSEGSYIYKVIDSALDSVSGSFGIILPDPLEMTIYNQENILFADVEGGIPPYQYSLDNGAFQMSNSFAMTSTGTHEITVKDAKECLLTDTYEAFWESSPQVSIEIIEENLCFDDEIAAVKIIATDGIPPYQLTMGSGTILTPVQDDNVFIIEGLGAGNYTFVVGDNTQQTVDSEFDIIAPDALALALEQVNNSIIATAAGGVPPYQYSLDGMTYQSDSTLIINNSNIYTVYVKDVNECIDNQVIEVISEELLVDIIVLQENQCFGDENAVIRLTISGGLSPYILTVGDSIVMNLDTTFIDIEGLGEGSYEFLITDKLEQEVVVTHAINTPDKLELNLAYNLNTITVTAAGGIPPYTYGIDNNPMQEDSMFVLIESGIYKLIVEDANGCTVSQETEMNFESLEVEYEVEGISCYGETDACITFYLSSQDSIYWVNFESSNFQVESDFHQICNLTPGTYDVTFTDVLNQQTSYAIEIPAIDSLIMETQVTGNQVLVVGSGGTPPYRYSYNNFAFEEENLFTDLPDGNYIFNMVDANNCIIISDTVLINMTATTDLDIKINQVISVYPNPPSDFLYVSFDDYPKDNFEVNIFNEKGQKVFTKSVLTYQTNREPLQLDVSKLGMGVYFLQVNGKDFQFAEKFVKISL